MKEFVCRGSDHSHLGVQIDSGVTHLGQLISERPGTDPQLLGGPVATPTLFPECLDDNTEFLLPQIITQRNGAVVILLLQMRRLLRG